METSELFKRFIGSAPGYEQRPSEPAPAQDEEAPKVPIIQSGKIVGWTTL